SKECGVGCPHRRHIITDVVTIFVVIFILQWCWPIDCIKNFIMEVNMKKLTKAQYEKIQRRGEVV
ncbi:hypothetical protein L0244_06240, partial [bacterium]|nr:hypothetical protein [bacterium]